MGFSCRPDRWADLLPDHDPEPDTASLVGAVRDLEGRAGDLGRNRRRHRRGHLVRAPAPGSWAEVRRFADATAPSLLVAQAIGRIGNYFNQELFGKPTSVPWGLEISPAHRPPGYTRFATFQPTFLYELIWDLSLAGFSDLAGPSPPDPGARHLRPLRGRLLGLSDLRGDAPDRLLQLHPRDAAELLDCHDPVPEWAGLVRGHPARLDAATRA